MAYFNNAATTYPKPAAVYEAMDKESLGNAIGKAQRAAAVLLDRGFSDALKKRLESNQ